jgi:hypothetical protein
MYMPVGITEEEHRTQMLALRKRELELQERELESSKSDRFWAAAGAIATAAIPIITFLGFAQYFRIGGGGKK